MKLFCLVVIQFVCCLVLSVVMPSGVSGTGVTMEACGPPDVPSYEINTTEEQFNRLVVQGRCYTMCVTDLIVFLKEVGAIRLGIIIISLLRSSLCSQ